MNHFSFRGVSLLTSAVFLLAVTVVPTRPVQAGTAIQVSPVPNGAEFAPDEYGENTQFCSLREAIQAANTDNAFGGCPAGSGADTIYIPAGKYRLTRAVGSTDTNAVGDLDITSDITILGAGHDDTIVSSTADDRIFDIHSDAAVINVNLALVKITGGSTKSSGGGIRNNKSVLTIQNVILDGNSGTPSASGGAIANLTLGKLILTNTTIIRNSAGYGGGIYNIGEMQIQNSLISSNTAQQAGGGIDIISEKPSSVINSTIALNSSNNLDQISGGGGGLAISGPLTITNSTIVDNVGEGLLINDDTATVQNTIVARNSGKPNCKLGATGVLQSGGNNLLDTGESGSSLCSFNGVGDQTVALDSDLMLDTVYGDHGGYTYTYAILSDASPAVDAIPEGNPYCPSFDQRWLIRTARCDVGAYEYGGLTPDQKVYLPAVRR